MKQKIIARGAEAIIYQEGKIVTKDRIKKTYRLSELDEKIRKRRTKKEIKLLTKASQIINSPLPIKEKFNGKTKITMPYIKGEKLSKCLDKLQKQKSLEICKQIGEIIAKLHNENIIHGDLTTSNIILGAENKIWFIDFGLGFQSEKIEDKAVDLHLIYQALEAKHFTRLQDYWKNILKGYKTSKNYKQILERLKKVESRGRYKNKK
ncbi:MAG: KEOPS complex kinase/ATPase Bud32 [Nanoarchaeota archaeon]|nr:KEOPS complex kinase/ATPase Bud32 [Nanoarchaeota archaeon]